MIRKQQPTKHGHMKVTFDVVDPAASIVQLAGNFNGWSERVPMQKTEDGHWQATLELDANRTYEYRYVINEDRWENDPAADAYSANPFGSDNCVIRT